MLKSLYTKNWTVKGDGIRERILTLPHDATMENGRDRKAKSAKSGAYYKPGRYEYLQTIEVPADYDGSDWYLQFEGVYPRCEVYLNGKNIGGCRYGYSGFEVKLDGLKAGENEICVKVDDANHPNSRWYAGAGIYRPVWLMVGNSSYIKPHGLKIKTVSVKPAKIDVEVDIAGEAVYDSDIKIEILKDGALVAEACGKNAEIEIKDAALWSAENPNLYECRVKLYKGHTVIDEAKENFGIRTISWSKEGFFINGESVLLKGGCIHHDNGVVGACSYAESEWRKVKILKDFGYNAIRSAHNPICEDLLKACDALGMYIMDESWDTWYKTKNPYDFGVDFYERYETDLKQMVDKDYNHPSVVMYSIGNEVTEPAKKEGIELTGKLVDKMHELDNSRPVTAGINITLLIMAKLPVDPIALFAGGNNEDEEDEQKQAPKEISSDQYNKMMAQAGSGMNNVNSGFLGNAVSKKVYSKLDIAGYNYGITRYEKEGKKNPGRVIVGSETYCQDIGKVWPMIERLPYVIGDFMWTSWDHLGEVGIGGYSYDKEDFTFEKKYPWKLSNAGAIDILGHDTAEAGLARVVFNKETKPYIGVRPANHPGEELATAVWRGTNAMPYWSYKGCEGNDVTVEVYSAADSVELFINNKSIGKKQLNDFAASFETKYVPGELKAVSYDKAGRKVGESILKSAKEDICLKAVVEPSYAKNTDSSNEKIVYVDFMLSDDEGSIEVNADRLLKASVEGGELLGFGSACPKTEEEYLTGEYTTYFGRAQAVVRKTADTATLTVKDEEGNEVIITL